MNSTVPPSLSNLSLSSYNQTNPIDLTLDDDDSVSDAYTSDRMPKRQRTENSRTAEFPTPSDSSPFVKYNPYHASGQLPPIYSNSPLNMQRQMPPSPIRPGFLQGGSNDMSKTYRPAFAGPSVFFPNNGRPARIPSATLHSSPAPSSPTVSVSTNRQVIDLTRSPSPPSPVARQMTPSISTLPPDLPPKTPVCIGQLTVTALVLYPVPYLSPQEASSGDAEWATVHLRYEHNPTKQGGSETIHIVTPRSRAPNGEAIQGEAFGVVEQKVATSLGPMLGKGLIRLDGKVRKGLPNVSLY